MIIEQDPSLRQGILPIHEGYPFFDLRNQEGFVVR